ncbi:MAG: hypothetical protein P8H60_00970 [Schleiferiaceae bacterium]|jgi:hypothetical protein|nr:hypothetical protein [Schleiferiaceae bacterium]
MRREFTSSITRLGPILTPERIIIDDVSVTYRRRNQHLIGVDEITIPLSRVSAVEVDKHIWGATIKIIAFGAQSIIADKFTWSDAKEVQRIINSMI